LRFTFFQNRLPGSNLAHHVAVLTGLLSNMGQCVSSQNGFCYIL